MLLSKLRLLTTLILCTLFAVSGSVLAKGSVNESAQDSEAKKSGLLVPLVPVLDNQPNGVMPAVSNRPTAKPSNQPGFKSKSKPISKPAAKPEFKKAKKEKQSR